MLALESVNITDQYKNGCERNGLQCVANAFCMQQPDGSYGCECNNGFFGPDCQGEKLLYFETESQAQVEMWIIRK